MPLQDCIRKVLNNKKQFAIERGNSLWSSVSYNEGNYDELNIKGIHHQIDGLVQERRNSSVLAMELRLSCTNSSKCYSNISSIHEK